MITQEQQLHAQWKSLEEALAARFGKPPSMEAILFMIGVNEYQGRTPKYKFSKEEKQDLMHVAVCKLLSQYNVYELDHIDEEGWPHYNVNEKIKAATLHEQETLLKKAIIDYYYQS